MDFYQVDVIDMTTQPDGDFSYIIHARDLFSDYSWGFAVTSRSIKEVAKHLLHIFSLFGPCGILQSDEGKEFVQSVVKELSIYWKDIPIIIGRGPNGHLRPVDRDKTDFITTLEKWMEFNGPSWSQGLPHVICKKILVDYAIVTLWSLLNPSGLCSFLIWGDKKKLK